MQHPQCDVEIGVHPGPFFIDTKTLLQVCSEHKKWYEERSEEFGPFAWEQQTDNSL